MLVSEKHPHPMICARGVSHVVLQALLEFIYCGEAKLQGENIDSFIQLSTDIELQGVTSEAFRKETLNAQEIKRGDGKV